MYLYPPRATTAMPKQEAYNFYSQLGWQLQIKFNDSHLELDYQNNTITTIWDRHGKKPAHDFRDLLPALNNFGSRLPGTGRFLLDGGLLHNKHTAIKNMVVLWDILIRDGKHLLGTTYQERYDWLYTYNTGEPYYLHDQKIGLHLGESIIIPECFQFSEWERVWEMVAAVNKHYAQPCLEGAVIKNPRGKLKHGLTEKNNSDWLCRSRVETKRHRY